MANSNNNSNIMMRNDIVLMSSYCVSNLFSLIRKSLLADLTFPFIVRVNYASRFALYIGTELKFIHFG